MPIIIAIAFGPLVALVGVVFAVLNVPKVALQVASRLLDNVIRRLS